ncbi:MAG: chromo domain-containing protein [Candidatus Nucleicultricaceae bacterium]
MDGNEASVYEIEKVLKRRHREGKEYCFVKWKGYSKKHNSWIPATSII